MAVAYLVVAVVIVVTMVVISFFCGGSSKKGDNEERIGQAVGGARPRAREGLPGARAVRRRPNRGSRMQIRDEDSDKDVGPGPVENWEISDEFKSMGAKKLRKLQEKAEKKRQREIEIQKREERKEREKKLEAQKKKEEEKLKAEAAARAEEEHIRKKEQEKREHEEYLKMKEMFSVEEEGEGDDAGDLDSQEFISYIKDMKVVMLEDLAAHFKIKTQDCINRIQDLQAEGKLTGVIDDRGKFIFITVEELDSVAKFIRQHGRVSIAKLAESSNRLINLNPDNANIRKKLIVGDNEPDLIEVA